MKTWTRADRESARDATPGAQVHASTELVTTDDTGNRAGRAAGCAAAPRGRTPRTPGCQVRRYDTAVRASIARAAKLAQDAQRDAYRASKVAAEAARQAAAKAKADQRNGVDPSGTDANDSVDSPGGWGGKDDRRDVAAALSALSAVSGGIAAFSLLVPPPAGEATSGVAGTISWVTGIGATVITGFTDGWTSTAWGDAASDLGHAISDGWNSIFWIPESGAGDFMTQRHRRAGLRGKFR
ncbi:hypothetical protein ACFYW9_02440 [Streptomyces sp. NPDC002698]|uniref:hypothetical protein n=1 Tax=Streptomyces sp. NPDC002698 TaxID=3364660 RepID=UPI00367568E0